MATSMRVAGRLKADTYTGEGDVVFSDAFHQMNALMQVDVLQDWMTDLETAHKKALRAMSKELGATEAAIVEEFGEEKPA